MFKFIVLITLIFGSSVHARAAEQAREQRGTASWYHEPQRTASGARFDPNAMTAAHRTLPFGTLVRVTHVRSRRSTLVRINDRGPFTKGRIIDLSKAAARDLQMIHSGTASVIVEVVSRPG
jgi:rare lipoprotein A